MSEKNEAAAAVAEESLAGGDAVDAVHEQVIQQLADRARAEGLQLTGEGGLLSG